MLISVASIVSISLAFGFALLHLALALKAPLGAYVLGGAHRVSPPKQRVLSGGLVFIFALIGLVFLQRYGAIGGMFSAAFVTAILIAYTGFLGFAIIGNGFLTKSPKEKAVMTPISAVGFVCALAVLIWG